MYFATQIFHYKPNIYMSILSLSLLSVEGNDSHSLHNNEKKMLRLFREANINVQKLTSTISGRTIMQCVIKGPVHVLT